MRKYFGYSTCGATIIWEFFQFVGNSPINNIIIINEKWIEFIYYFSVTNASHLANAWYVQHSVRVTFYALKVGSYGAWSREYKNILRNTAFIHTHTHHSLANVRCAADVFGVRIVFRILHTYRIRYAVDRGRFIQFLFYFLISFLWAKHAHTWKIENETQYTHCAANMCVRVCWDVRTHAVGRLRSHKTNTKHFHFHSKFVQTK